MKISIKGFVLGFLINLLCLFLVSVVIASFAFSYIQENGGLYESISSGDNKSMSLILVAIGLSFSLVFFISGWLTAKNSSHSQLFTALSVGFLISLFAFIPYEDKDLEIAAIQFLIPIVFSYLGAKIFLKRANKVKNLRSLRSLGRAEDARPF